MPALQGGWKSRLLTVFYTSFVSQNTVWEVLPLFTSLFKMQKYEASSITIHTLTKAPLLSLCTKYLRYIALEHRLAFQWQEYYLSQVWRTR